LDPETVITVVSTAESCSDCYCEMEASRSRVVLCLEQPANCDGFTWSD